MKATKDTMPHIYFLLASIKVPFHQSMAAVSGMAFWVESTGSLLEVESDHCCPGSSVLIVLRTHYISNNPIFSHDFPPQRVASVGGLLINDRTRYQSHMLCLYKRSLIT